jgi:4-diphosphocytidyl-2-C-methyl-D-erythritol kinase
MAETKQITETDNGLLVLAPAKINLSLLIAGKRADGFHEIETIMAKIDLCDELLLEPMDTEGIHLRCRGKYPAPDGPENLVYQACCKLSQVAGITPAVKLTLTKNIPAGAGLGGGSSDAAAALIGLNRMAGLNLPLPRLSEIASELGSDVPFFLGGPLSFCTGKGEKIKKIEKIFNFTAILALPAVKVLTKKVYDNYLHDENLYETLNNQIKKLTEKKSIDLVSRMCANMLQSSCFGQYGQLGRIKGATELLCGRDVALSGSGSAMFCMVAAEDEKNLKRYQSKLLESTGCVSVVVHNNRW